MLCAVLCAIGFSAYAQNSAVKGTVTSSEDGAPIPGVSVVYDGTTVGTMTDASGHFTLPAGPAGATNVVFSCIGYTTKVIPVSLVSSVVMDPDTEFLDEVVVTALGIERQKKSLGYAVQDVKAESLTQGSQQNVANALQGKLAGVQITQAGGAVGASQRIIIRGNSSFNGNEPLIVIDGIPMDNSAGGVYGGDDGGWLDTGSGINDINPEDIESISVLKGGSAAIYGMRAGNGVILITTKKGASVTNKMKVTYDGSFTVDRVFNLPRYQNLYGQGYQGHEYAYKFGGYEDDDEVWHNWVVEYSSYADFAVNEGYFYVNGKGAGANDGDDESWGPRLDSGLMIPQYNSPVVDGVRQATPWVSHPNNIKDFFQTGFTNSHTVSVSNSSDRGSYRASLGVRQQNGVVPNTDISHFNGNLSSNYNFSKFFSADMSLYFNRTHSNNLIPTGYTSDSPLQSIMQWFGRQVDMQDLKANYMEKMANGSWYNWISAFHVNPYFNVYQNTNSYDRDRVIAKGSFFFKPTSWLKAEARVGYDLYHDQTFQKTVYSTDMPYGWFGKTLEDRHELNMDGIVYFNKQFGDFAVDALAGANYRDMVYSSNYLGANPSNGLTIPGLYTMSNVVGVPITEMDNSHIRSNSIYANASVGWKGQVYLEASFRRDWSSTISKAFSYPSVSASWIITESFPFIKGDVLNYLKVRANWANIGNATSAYRTGLYYSSPGKSINGQSQYNIPTELANPNLRPENINTMEFGLESAFWNNRVRFDLAVYKKKTSDQIMRIEVPRSSGYSYEFLNAGCVSNAGAEISLGVDVFKNPNGFNWTSTLNWSKDKSTIDELAEDLNTYTLGTSWSCYNYAKVGKSWGTLVGTGLVRDDDGNVIVDAYGFPKSKANMEIGDVTPKWLAGWNNEFSYKNLSFGFLLDFRKGGDFYSVSQAFGAYTGIYDYTAANGIRENGAVFGKDIVTNMNFVKEDGTPNDIVVDPEDAFYYFYGIKELAVIDGSFLKLREAHITYTLPASITKKVKWIDSAKLSVVGNNLAILWLAKNNYSNIDPESSLGSGNSSVGYESNACPPTRSIGVKLNITF